MTASEVEGLQAALRAEHTAIWGYGIVGASLSPEARQSVRDLDVAHRAARDDLADLIRSRGADPDPTEASYELPFPVVDATGATQLAAVLESGVARGYAFSLSRADTQQAKEFSLTALTDAALRQTTWHQVAGIAPVTPEFPGL